MATRFEKPRDNRKRKQVNIAGKITGNRVISGDFGYVKKHLTKQRRRLCETERGVQFPASNFLLLFGRKKSQFKKRRMSKDRPFECLGGMGRNMGFVKSKKKCL